MDKPSLQGIPKINVSLCFLSMKKGSFIVGCLAFLFVLLTIIHTTVEIHRIPEGDLSSEILWFVPVCTGFYCALFGGLYISYLLIRGIVQNEPKDMFPWIYTGFGILIMIFIFMLFIIVLITFARIQQQMTTDFIIFFTILLILIFGFLVYLWAIVATYCRQLMLSQYNKTPQHRRLLN